jgi:CRP-like cAMP-binding protein
LERFSSGTILFKEGDKSNNKLYMILEGSVVLLKKKVLDFDLSNE